MGDLSSTSLTKRRLVAEDEPALRAFWAIEPHANLFAEPDLDTLGWHSPKLEFWGWFDGEHLIAYLMRYGISAQWYYTDPRVVGAIATAIDRTSPRIEFTAGVEEQGWPVLNHLQSHRVGRFERGRVAVLQASRFVAERQQSATGRARAATLADIDALTALHMAAPDRWTTLTERERHHVLRQSVLDRSRRLFLAETLEGRPIASAQTIAEGRRLAVIGGVVTHPAWRGQGFATLATAALCGSLLQLGLTPYLFYRRTNRPAAHVYRKIGFEGLGDWLITELDP